MKITLTSCFQALALVTATVTATNLYVSSYIGTVTSLSLSLTSEGSYSLETVAVNDGSAPNSSFLLLNPQSGVLYATDENLSGGNGSITAYSTSINGTLTLIKRHVTIGGPVYIGFYNDRKFLALAHYGSSSVSSWSILPDGDLKFSQSFTFTQAPRANPRQDAPHPHGVFLDPTTKYLLVPDLGADQVRIFQINKETGYLDILPSLNVTSGSGPRHATFLTTKYNSTYLFIISELGNSVTSYRIIYETDGPHFTEVYDTGILGSLPIPAGVTAAEIVITPNKDFILTSSRNDSLFHYPDPHNASATLTSDSLRSWTIDPESGGLSLHQLAPAGGKTPRQFSINKNGTLAAVALQGSSKVTIVARDEISGDFETIVAEVDVPGEVNTVVWDVEHSGTLD